MINRSLPEYYFIRVCIIVLQLLVPCSVIYTPVNGLIIAFTFVAAGPHRSLGPLPLQIYCLLETLHAAVLNIYFLPAIQRPAEHPPLRSREQRQALFHKAASEIQDPEAYVRGWFRHAARIEDIGREDLRDFIAWAFFESRETDEDGEELEKYVQTVEQMVAPREFTKGRGRAKGLRLTVDAVGVGGWTGQRSLVWYAIVGLVDTITFVRMRWAGFGFWRRRVGWVPKVWPLRPLVLLPEGFRGGKTSATEGLGYWYRPHTSKKRVPVLFLHGIGVGLHPHVDFFRELESALNGSDSDDDGQVGILIPEILPISARITAPILRREAFLDQLTRLLDSHDIERFVLSSHSYGSVLSTHILQHPRLASRVSSILFIDPVSILLHLPDVAYNFTARAPQQANEWQLWYFASKDPGVAWTLGRHFFWSENVLWRENLEAFMRDGERSVTVSLAGRDLIVDADAVGSYLIRSSEGDINGSERLSEQEHGLRRRENGQKVDDQGLEGCRRPGSGYDSQYEDESGNAWKQQEWIGKGLEVMWFPDTDHAQVFDTMEKRQKLIRVLAEYCKGR